MLRLYAPLFVALLLACGWFAADAGEEVDGGIEWMVDLDAARARAKEEGRPLLVVFR